MKVIFVVRNPVERLYSHYKFAYHSSFAKFGNFDDFVLPGMALGGKFGELREMISNNTALKDVVDYFYNVSYAGSGGAAGSNSGGGGGGALGTLFMHSLYALPVAHYIQVLGKENVKVVSAEDLDVRDPVRVVDTLNAIFAFIGICQVPITDLVPSLPSRNTVPVAKQMSQDMHTRLTKFFRPLNNLLMAVAGADAVNVTRWNEKAPPMKLQRYTPRLNKTMPDLWFEIKEANANKKLFTRDLMPHLVPQR